MAWFAVLGLLAGMPNARAQFTPRVPEATPPPAAVQPSSPLTAPGKEMEQRVRELEETVRQLQEKTAPGRAAATVLTPDAPPASAQFPPSQPIQLETGDAQGMFSGSKAGDGAVSGWDNGFFMRSPDGAYQLRITGQIQADLRDFLRHDDVTDVSGFLVRRARLGIEATVYKYFEFRLLPDFGQGKAAIQDAYLNVHYIDELQIAAGKLKQPVSYEQLIQDRFVPTVERSLIDQLVPARDVGVMIHGQKLLGNKLDYAVGVFNGGINGDQDTNGHKDIAWRVAVRPFDFVGDSVHVWLGDGLRLLQVGISGTTGIEEEPISPAILRTPAMVPYFQFNSAVRASGLRNRWSPELSYFYDGLGIAAQYYREDQEMIPTWATKTPVTVPFEGYYFMATYLVTGESRTTYSAAVVPLRAFDPLHPLSNPGAWELVGRYAWLDVGSVVFASGAARLADPTKYAREASELTLGFNWYLNAWVRMQFNWEHARFGSPVQLAPGAAGLLRGQDTLLTRLQVIF